MVVQASDIVLLDFTMVDVVPGSKLCFFFWQPLAKPEKKMLSATMESCGVTPSSTSLSDHLSATGAYFRCGQMQEACPRLVLGIGPNV